MDIMKDEIQFTSDDSIAIIAPHPDDECIGNAGALIRIPSQVDIYVVSDGCYGNRLRSVTEEAKLRREWFEQEMSIVQPRNYYWMGIQDTKISENLDFASQIDFTRYTKVFLPWKESIHIDHRAAYEGCHNQIIAQSAVDTEYYMYEICAPFRNPRYFVDITDVIDKKRELIRCHEEMNVELDIVITLNRFRAAQLYEHPMCEYAEAYDKVEIL